LPKYTKEILGALVYVCAFTHANSGLLKDIYSQQKSLILTAWH